MDETSLADVVAAAYEAASGGDTWLEFGRLLRHLCGAQRSTLRFVDGSLTNLLAPSDQCDAEYLAYYHQTDPYRAHAAADKGHQPPNTARVGPSIVPVSELRRTEYFTDFAARHGMHHMMGGKIGLRTPLPIGLHREESLGAFSEREMQSLELVLPHLARALQLHARLRTEARANSIGTAALDALPLPVLIVNATMQVLHANAAAGELTAPGRSGLTVSRAGLGGTHLSARHRDDNAALRRLVARAAAGGAGGALRVRGRHDDVPEEATLAVQVGPVPARYITQGTGLAKDFAMIATRELARPSRVEEAVLCDLYGLTRAEAAVAGALVGGVTAEEVARTRNVSLDTIRTQVRTVLRKTNATNLRDFERIAALVSA